MATATVLYVLNQGGNLQAGLDKLGPSLRKVAVEANAAKASVESMGTKARSSLASVGEQAGVAAEGIGKFAVGAVGVGFAVNAILQRNREWEESSKVLTSSLGTLADQIADTFGPGAATMMNRFTVGLAGIVGFASADISGTGLSDMLDKIRNRQHVAASDLKTAFDESLQIRIDATADAVHKVVGAINDAQAAAAFVGPTLDMVGRSMGDIKTHTDNATKSLQNYIDAILAAKAAGTLQGFGSGDTFQTTPLTKDQTKAFGGAVQSTAITGAGAAPPELVAATKDTTAAVGGVLGAVAGGTSSMLAAIGPIGAMISAILDIMANFSDIVGSTNEKVVGAIHGFADQFDEVVNELTVDLIAELPGLIADILTLIPKMILSLIASGPRILGAVIEAILHMPKAIGQAFGDMFAKFWADIKESIRELGSVLTGKEGKFLGTSFAGKDNAGNRSLFGIGGNKFDTGGRTTSDGWGFLHKNEVVLNPQQQRQAAARGGGATQASVAIHVHGVTDVDQLMRQMRTRLGSYGIGLTLEPRTGG